MKVTSRTLSLSILVLAVFVGSWIVKETFTSPGTMVQLSSSHVPTREDYEYDRYIYPKVVRRDITDMTGEDPGPIHGPMPDLWV